MGGGTAISLRTHPVLNLDILNENIDTNIFVALILNKLITFCAVIYRPRTNDRLQLLAVTDNTINRKSFSIFFESLDKYLFSRAKDNHR